MMSALQNINPNRGSPEWLLQLRESVEFVKFCCVVMRMQYRAGRYFVLEHPASSQIWLIREIADRLRMKGVGFTTVDMCQYG